MKHLKQSAVKGIKKLEALVQVLDGAKWPLAIRAAVDYGILYGKMKQPFFKRV